MFLKSGEYLIATQKAFHGHFMFRRNYAIQERKSILQRVEHFSSFFSFFQVSVIFYHTFIVFFSLLLIIFLFIHSYFLFFFPLNPFGF